MYVLFRKLSYVKGIYQAQYNDKANDCHGTHSQPTCRIIADMENDCPSCPSCSCHRYWLSGRSAEQLVILRRLYSNIKKEESCRGLGLMAGYDEHDNEPSVSKMAPELLSGRATISLRVSELS
jgi:hypothetical protein